MSVSYKELEEELMRDELTFDDKVKSYLKGIETMLIKKNRKYGNSALSPKRIFSKASTKEQLLVRIDDKLSRIANMQTDEDEDVISDLIGYLVLLELAG